MVLAGQAGFVGEGFEVVEAGLRAGRRAASFMVMVDWVGPGPNNSP